MTKRPREIGENVIDLTCDDAGDEQGPPSKRQRLDGLFASVVVATTLPAGDLRCLKERGGRVLRALKPEATHVVCEYQPWEHELADELQCTEKRLRGLLEQNRVVTLGWVRDSVARGFLLGCHSYSANPKSLIVPQSPAKPSFLQRSVSAPSPRAKSETASAAVARADSSPGLSAPQSPLKPAASALPATPRKPLPTVEFKQEPPRKPESKQPLPPRLPRSLSDALRLGGSGGSALTNSADSVVSAARPMSDAHLQRFVALGFLEVQPAVSESLVDSIYAELNTLKEARRSVVHVPAIAQVLADASVQAALAAILGPHFMLHPHRHVRLSKDTDQPWHRDSFFFYNRGRSLRPDWVWLNFYPQAVTHEMGPTGVLPGTQTCSATWGDKRKTLGHNQELGIKRWHSTKRELTVPKGRVVIGHHDLWHAGLGRTPGTPARWMFHLNFVRLSDPRQALLGSGFGGAVKHSKTWSFMSDCIKDAKAQAKASSGTPDPAIKFAAERARCWLRVWRYLRGADPACQEEPLAASGAGPGGAGRGSVGQHQAVGVGSSESKAAGSSESKAGADGVPRLRSRWTALGRREIEEHAAAKFLFFDCDSDPRQLDTALFLTQTTAKSAGDIEFGAIALLAGLFSPSECVSRNCSYALGALSYRHPLLAAVVNELIFILASGGDAHFSLPPEVPVSALETAGGFESKPAYNRPAPKKNLTPHERARLHAAWALNQLGPVVSRVAPAALEAIAAAALGDPELTVRREATEALGACATAPRPWEDQKCPATTALIRLLRDPSQDDTEKEIPMAALLSLLRLHVAGFDVSAARPALEAASGSQSAAAAQCMEHHIVITTPQAGNPFIAEMADHLLHLLDNSGVSDAQMTSVAYDRGQRYPRPS